ncbi:integrase [Collibacillus ludicampi]|uniref:Integrase n=1 Tax=Collibacillus ludicampi TaxID=2771369 RepID=A0AAV4L9Q0_9BACL|nr:site-specific integrase [Collibacillus ludicampi]GIM44522.1 integrase [Collibacillus ludicampi]
MEIALKQTNAVTMERVEQLIQKANEYTRKSKSDNTIKAYQSDWAHFTAWCEQYGQESLPASPETVMLYITTLADEGYKTSTINRRISSISKAHQSAGYKSPTRNEKVRELWNGIKRTHGTAQQAKKAAVIDDVRRMVDTLGDTTLDIRDRALLLIGFAGALRRSELVTLNVEDIQITDDGLTITIRKSKTDQEGEGRKIGIPYGSCRETCPVRSYMKWVEVSGIKSGAVFRGVTKGGNVKDERLSDKGVARVVKRCAEAAGLDPAQYAGHSLRSGFATTAARAGASDRAIMRQTGHKSRVMVDRYIQEGSLFRDNAAAKIGL